MSNFCIPLNDKKYPLPNCITIELANIILQNSQFLQFKNEIYSDKNFKKLITKPKILLKKMFSDLMAEDLSNLLTTQITKQSFNRTKKTNLLTPIPKFSSKKNLLNTLKSINSIKSIQPQENYLNSIQSLQPKTSYFNTIPRTLPLISAVGGSLVASMSDQFIDFIIVMIFILFLFNNLVLKGNVMNNIKNMTNISTKKNEYRMVYMVVTNTETYFLKIAPSPTNLSKERLNQAININNLNFNDHFQRGLNINEYIYECMFYNEMNNETGINYNGRDLSTYVSEIVDWNIVNVDSSSSEFTINLEQENINIMDIPVTYFDGINNINTKLKNSILMNNWIDPSNYYSFSLVKNYKNFITLRQLINDRAFRNILEIYKNGCNLLRLFYQAKGFCHWDLHSDNILVNPNSGEVKLFDFDLSQVRNSYSDIFNRLPFLDDPFGQYCFKPILGHLYDYYRFINENLDYNNNLKRALYRESGASNRGELIEFFVMNDFLEDSSPNYSNSEIKKIISLKKNNLKNTKISTEYRDHIDNYFENLLETIQFFNEIQ